MKLAAVIQFEPFFFNKMMPAKAKRIREAEKHIKKSNEYYNFLPDNFLAKNEYFRDIFSEFHQSGWTGGNVKIVFFIDYLIRRLY